jgi:hypothetical protein
MKVSRDLSKCKLVVQEVRWEAGGTEPTQNGMRIMN